MSEIVYTSILEIDQLSNQHGCMQSVKWENVELDDV